MTERTVLLPTAEHPITITPTGKHVTVRVNGEVVAETDAALTLQESTYPAVQYVPLADVVGSALRRSDNTTYCPYKGEANYYHVVTGASEATGKDTVGGDTVDDAIWTYEQPYPAVGEIVGHVAFYANKADVTVG
ncbi:DUF427 domain-containing protein [Mycobacterium sp. AZCC_0083]|uniref:DUF427 domain-containing protein n=1 Tax=Mycobacterium sp. AZCC_0083 TaxID=2735882 RepID=UPI00160A6325|nr:DUF427 domain-containing protein [Mycobacterium sp. AZCC_0083]MBB5166544.1 uncharacterized protein (DUF427 family) [Mycobacterium sp. AZCC_0083]